MGIKPTLSHFQCDALPIELPCPWEQGVVGRKVIQVLVLRARNIKLTFLMKQPWVTI